MVQKNTLCTLEIQEPFDFRKYEIVRKRIHIEILEAKENKKKKIQLIKSIIRKTKILKYLKRWEGKQLPIKSIPFRRVTRMFRDMENSPNFRQE